IAISISLSLFYLFNPGARKVTEIEKRFSQGVTYYNERKDTLALENFLVVIEALPDLPHAKELLATSSLFNAGCCEYRLNKYDDAIEHLKRLTEEFPDNEKSQDALLYLGDLYRSEEEYDESIKSYQAYIESKPENIDAIIDAKLQIVLCHSKKKDPEGALKLLESLEAEYPGQLLLKQKCDHLRFLTYTGSEQVEEVIELVEDIIRPADYPWTNDICFRFGNLLFEKEQYPRAIDFYQRIVSKADEIERIEAYAEKVKEKKIYESDVTAVGYKRWEESTLDYQVKGIKDNPDLLPHALFQIGRCHFLSGDNKAAEEIYSKILEQYTEEEDLIERTRVEIGLCYLKDGNTEAFEQSVSKIESEEVRYILLHELHKEKLYKVLIKKYEKGAFSFEEEKNKSSSLYLVADAHYEIGDFSAALKLFGEVAEKYPESEQGNPAKFRVGQSLLELKQYEQALLVWDELSEIYAERKPDITYMLAYTYLCLKKYGRALDYSNRFLEEYPENELVPEAKLCRGSALIGQQNYAEAIVDFKELIKDYPSHQLVPAAYANIGRIYYYQEKFPEMIAIFLKLEKEYPEDKGMQAEARYWLGLGNEHEGRFKSAIDKYREIADLYPESEWLKEAQMRIGCCYIQRKEYELAIKAYLVAIDKWGEDKDYLLRVLDDLNAMFWKTADYGRAIGLYRELIEKYSNMSNYLSLRLAGIYYYAGNDIESATIYREILPILPRDIFTPQDRYMIGEVFLKTEYYREALDNYLTFLSEVPPPPQVFIEEATRGIVYCYFKLGDPSVGKRLKELVKNYPYTEKLPEVNLASGEMNRLQGKYKQAISFYKEAIKNLTDDELTALALLGLGECYRHLGNYKEAVLYYKRVELIYGYYTDLVKKAKTGFEECNKYMEKQQGGEG
ncbi:MAG: tetratricopeptide repeat protein, partial [bacterium]|nr:tetratricopeptide repeat protein [bacterium]